jgi:hypothetical protein
MAENAALSAAGKIPVRHRRPATHRLRATLLLATALAPLLACPPEAHAEAPRWRHRAPDAAAAAEPAAAPAPLEDHPDSARLVLPAPKEGTYGFARSGGQLVIYPPDGMSVGDLSHLPHNVAAIRTGDGQIVISGKPGTRISAHLSGGRLMVDVVDAPHPDRAAKPAATRAEAAKAEAARPAAPVRPEAAAVNAAPIAPHPQGAAAPAPVASPAPAAPAVAAAPVAVTAAVPTPAAAPPAKTSPVTAPVAAAQAAPPLAAPPPAAPQPAAAPQAPPPPAAEPVTVQGTRIERADGRAGPSILLPTTYDIGAAAFRSGADLLVVLDAALDFQPPGPDLPAGFSQLSSRRTHDATVIRIPGIGPAARLDRVERGWLVTLAPPAAPLAGILPKLVKSPGVAAYLRMPAAQPSRVVIVLDPQTGGRLLVGTQAVTGQAVTAARHDVQFGLAETLQGVVVVPTSDDLTLTTAADAFLLSAGPQNGGGIVSSADPAAADAGNAPVSQMLDLPTDPTPALAARLAQQIRAAADTPALARTAPRLRVAQTMLALGMGPEADSVIDVAADDDPASRDSRQAVALRGVGAVLAGRLDEAATLADPRLNGTTEIELWRSLLHVGRNQADAADAHVFRAALPLAQAYALPLRQRVLPVMLETMALNGEAAAALAAAKALPDDHALDLARAMALEATNQPAEALKAYDNVAKQGDRLDRYTGMLRAVELRLRGGQLDARGAADALDHELYGWRGEDQELPLRLRIGALRRKAGQWPEALAVLRDGREALPDARPQIDQALAATFLDLFNGDAAQHMPAADFVKLYDANVDLVQSIAWPEAAGMNLVNRLVGLDLLARAEPVMARLVSQSSDPQRRPMLGAQLASLRMATDDPAGALQALGDTAPQPGVSVAPDVLAARQLLYARGEAGRGNTDGALGMLARINNAEADGLRADLYSDRKDWPHAVAALTALEQKQITAPDKLSDAQQALVLRLAEAATLASDAATLDRLSRTYGAAMAGGSSATLFQLVTSPPVTGSADVPRALGDIELARKLPASLGVPAP